MKADRSAGFSLVEMMITVSIIGILGLVAVPGLYEFIPKYRVEGAAKALATEVSLTRMKALAANRTYHLAFDPPNQKIYVYRDDDNNWATANTLVKTIDLATEYPNISLDYNSVTGVDGTPLTQAATFGTSASPVRATFLPNGLLADRGVFYVIPTSDKGRRDDRMRALRVTRAAGLTRLRYKASVSPPWEEY